ncbi:hypothetical protein GCM10010300_55090 [Streptomyces olivaceoviridis]|uniref:hypothetical protein n=1 Tax=Streptomyces olivaceoviridis TaxID=1921 RepID=UPI00167BD732|nr:hypothetical protein [Streptomyces olivaceoviridis]GGZ04259.1 hypothetical protein GCM10010300_55090 [Streptomyces olivaceoviridis]
MADEQYTWLNRETAERLLRGESLEAVDPSARDQAERLSRALGALSAEAASAPGELPGEQAALAAFRKAREAAEAERTAAAHAPTAPRTPARGADAGLVRIGAPARTGTRTRRPRWARPVRLALAAAVAAGTLGGVAVAAGTGVLPTPFGDDHPRPATSVSPDTTTGQPLTSPSAPGGGTGTGAPDGGTRGHRGGTDDEAAGTGDGTGAPSATSGTGWLGATAACRALRDGKDLDAGRRRALEHLAGGPGRVTTYCKVLLGTGDSASGGTGGVNSGGSGDKTTGQGSGNGKGGGKDNGKDNGKGGEDGPADPDGGKGSGKAGGNGNGSGGDNGKGNRNGGGNGKGGDEDGGEGNGKGGGRQHGGADPAPSAFAPAHRGTPGNGSTTPSPTPTYTAL